MADQPKNRPSPSDFFADGRSGATADENTVARGALDNDVYTVSKEYAGFPLPGRKPSTAAKIATKFLHPVTDCKVMARAWPPRVA
jgi:hypothetical protein